MPQLSKIQHRRGTASAWTTANPVLDSGEIGLELAASAAIPHRIKIGDGVTAWSSLPYADEAPPILEFWSDADKLAGIPFATDNLGVVYSRQSATYWFTTNFNDGLQEFSKLTAGVAGVGAPAGWYYNLNSGDEQPYQLYSLDLGELWLAAPASAGWTDMFEGTLTFSNGATPAVAGQKAKIIGQANRLEQFLGGDQDDQANWLPGNNTVELTVQNDEVTEITINGVVCGGETLTFVGWVDPQQIASSSTFTISQIRVIIDELNVVLEEELNILANEESAGVFGLNRSFPPRAGVGITVTAS